jgi:hypothetical protein
VCLGPADVIAWTEFLEWTDTDHLRHSKFVGLREHDVTGFNQYGASSHTAYPGMILSLEVDHGGAPGAYPRGVLKFTSFVR